MSIEKRTFLLLRFLVSDFIVRIADDKVIRASRFTSLLLLFLLLGLIVRPLVRHRLPKLVGFTTMTMKENLPGRLSEPHHISRVPSWCASCSRLRAISVSETQDKDHDRPWCTPTLRYPSVLFSTSDFHWSSRDIGHTISVVLQLASLETFLTISPILLDDNG